MRGRALTTRELQIRHDRAARLLAEIERYIEVHGYPPSRREAAEMVGSISSSEGQRFVEYLIENGQITTTPGIARSIRITGTNGSTHTESM